MPLPFAIPLWLSAVGKFFAAIPWWGYTIAAILLVGYVHGERRFDAGRDEVQAVLDGERAENARLAEEAKKAAREQERIWTAAFKKAVDDLKLENQNAEVRLETVLDDLTAARVRLRERFRCPAAGGATDPAGSSEGSDGARERGLLDQDVRFLVRFAADADRVVRKLNACQAVVTSLTE